MKQFVAITEDGKYLHHSKNTGFGTKDILRKVDSLHEASFFSMMNLRPIGNSLSKPDLDWLNNCNHLEAVESRVVTLVKEEKS